jgi:hypothetical protein
MSEALICTARQNQQMAMQQFAMGCGGKGIGLQFAHQQQPPGAHDPSATYGGRVVPRLGHLAELGLQMHPSNIQSQTSRQQRSSMLAAQQAEEAGEAGEDEQPARLAVGNGSPALGVGPLPLAVQDKKRPAELDPDDTQSRKAVRSGGAEMPTEGQSVKGTLDAFASMRLKPAAQKKKKKKKKATAPPTPRSHFCVVSHIAVAAKFKVVARVRAR